MPQSWPVLIVGLVLGLISLSVLGCLFYAFQELEALDPLKKPDLDSLSFMSEAIYSYASEAARESNLNEFFATAREIMIVFLILGTASILVLLASIYLIYAQLKRTGFEYDPENA
ncbi:MAG: hypothetical protein CBC13_04590 [Planctomycetia bacterium TMED53]|nr:MAG: hypothetical protein CBC13_04590 [Planctomycetia bacterium TMED53]